MFRPQGGGGGVASVSVDGGLINSGTSTDPVLSTGLEIRNSTGTTLNPGELLFLASSGGELRAMRVVSDDSPYALYVVKDAIADGALGYVYGQVVVENIDTSAYPAETYLFLSSETPGGWTDTEPTGSLTTSEAVGIVLTSHATTGSVFFFPGATFTIMAPLLQHKIYVIVKNISGSTIDPGTPIAISGWQGDYPLVVRADANNNIPATHVSSSFIPNNQQGYALLCCTVTDLDTSGRTIGDAVYLSETAGEFTFTAPTTANAMVQQVGVVTTVDASTGTIFFQPGYAKISKIGSNEVQDGAGAAGVGIMKRALVVYDFAVDGGAVGNIALTGAPTIPDNAVVKVVSADIITALDSATQNAEVSLTLPVDGALTTSISIGGGFGVGIHATAEYSNGGFLNTAPPTILKTTAARVPTFTVATEALTQGKIIFELEYWISQ